MIALLLFPTKPNFPTTTYYFYSHRMIECEQRGRPHKLVAWLFCIHFIVRNILGSIKFSTKDLEDINKVPPGGLSISRTFETDLLFLLHFDIIFTTTQKRSEQKVEVEKHKTF